MPEKCRVYKILQEEKEGYLAVECMREDREHIYSNTLSERDHMALLEMNEAKVTIVWSDNEALRFRLKGAFTHALRGTHMDWPGMTKNRNIILDDLVDAAMKVIENG